MRETHITIGQVVANPHFDLNADYAIYADNEDDKPLYESTSGTEIPSELLICWVTYMTVRDNVLILEVHGL